jgi:methyl-accepting chemotaxis protein
MLAKIVDFPSNKSKSNHDDSLSSILGFLNRVSAIADSTTTFAIATQQIFVEVGKFTHWPIGHLYTRDNDTYISQSIWYVEDGLNPSAIKDFVKISENTIFEKGKGIIGQIAQTKEAKALEDVTTLKQFLRADAAKRSGVRGFFGFPILINGTCVGVVEFYGRQIGLLDSTSLKIMQYVSSQLARLYEREQAQIHQQHLMDQFQNNVQTSISQLVDNTNQLHVVGQDVQTQSRNNNQQCAQVVEGRNSIEQEIGTLKNAIEQLVHLETQTTSTNSSMNKTVSHLSQNISDTLQQLEKLAKVTANIESITRNVTEISGQVRMLGLNASIEAARAGESGKGFAIVAAEIKSLALQSEKSSQDISEQLHDIQRISDLGIVSMNTVKDSMGMLEGNAQQMSNVVHDQNEATTTIETSLSCAQSTFADITREIEVMSHTSSNALKLSEDVSTQVQAIKGLSQTIATSSLHFIEALKGK